MDINGIRVLLTEKWYITSRIDQRIYLKFKETKENYMRDKVRVGERVDKRQRSHSIIL